MLVGRRDENEDDNEENLFAMRFDGQTAIFQAILSRYIPSTGTMYALKVHVHVQAPELELSPLPILSLPPLSKLNFCFLSKKNSILNTREGNR